ncbi:PEP-utilizing enzyme [Streptomyces kronopolitis]|uniref:PEP-utilizing enzyme n=1 Tax=Streptomyces kronopolitis TaxID=1612435 RepID=UPI003D992891
MWVQCRPVTRELGRPDVPAPGTEATGLVLTGVAASQGTARGRAVRLRGPDEPGWEPGSILVTRETGPEWVPLMTEAAGLVTAVGSMLCHAAILARELGLPCVTGVGEQALAALPLDVVVEVDGSRGRVAVS